MSLEGGGYGCGIWRCGGVFFPGPTCPSFKIRKEALLNKHLPGVEFGPLTAIYGKALPESPCGIAKPNGEMK